MGVSLSVFKIKDYKKENFVGNEEIYTLTGQLNFKDLELGDNRWLDLIKLSSVH